MKPQSIRREKSAICSRERSNFRHCDGPGLSDCRAADIGEKVSSRRLTRSLGAVPSRQATQSPDRGTIMKRKDVRISVGNCVLMMKSQDQFVCLTPNRWTGNRIKGSLFKISGRDSSGSYRRIQINAESLEVLCQKVGDALFPDDRKEDPRRLQLADAFALWFQTLQIRDYTRKGYHLSVSRFLKWTDSRGIRTLGELSRHHVQSYVAGMQGLSHHTMFTYFRVVRSLGIWASLNWDEIRDFSRGIRIRNTNPIWDDQRQSLSFEMVSALLLWLRSHPDGASVLPGVALSGLCGLRLTEAFRLTWDSINLDRGTVTVCGMIKNRESLRTIPVPGLVLDILQDTPRGARLINNFSKWTYYGKALGVLLKAWGVVQIEPKGLRRTIETEAVRRGWQGYCLNRYLGRSPQSIQERHYIAMADDLQRVLREQVASRIDQIIEPFRAEWNRENPKVISLAR